MGITVMTSTEAQPLRECKPKPSIYVRADYVVSAISALEYRAAVEAGHSQAPDLFDKEDTEYWRIAQELRHKYKTATGVQLIAGLE